MALQTYSGILAEDTPEMANWGQCSVTESQTACLSHYCGSQCRRQLDWRICLLGAIHNNNLITGGNVSIDGKILPDKVYINVKSHCVRSAGRPLRQFHGMGCFITLGNRRSHGIKSNDNVMLQVISLGILTTN